MKLRQKKTTRPPRPHLIARMNVAAVLGTTFLFGSLTLPETAEARPSIEGSNATLNQERGRLPYVWADLTENGKALEARYAKELEDLQAEIRGLIPSITDTQHEVFLAHLSSAASAHESLLRSKNQLRNFVDYEQAVANFQRAEQNIENAKKTVATRHAYLEYARALPDDNPDKAFIIEHGEGQLSNRKRDLERAPKQLEDAKQAMERAGERRDQLAAEKQERKNAIEEIKSQIAQLAEAGMGLLTDAGLGNALSNQQLDEKLATFMVLREADPYWLAVYAQQGPE